MIDLSHAFDVYVQTERENFSKEMEQFIDDTKNKFKNSGWDNKDAIE